MFWSPTENRIEFSTWAQFADNPLKLTTGKKATKSHIDPNMSKSSTEDIDPALLQPGLQALRFFMAVQLSNFTDEVIVQKQEHQQDQLNQVTSTPVPVPEKYKDILKHPDKEGWLKAIQEELENLYCHKIWTIKLPHGKHVMGARWFFVEKRTADRKIIKLKARYVAKGYAQIAGVEFMDMFAPTATFLSLWLLLTVAAKCYWTVYSFDFVAAYLHSPINKEVWVRPPEGLDVPKGHVCKLQKALYGTKQAACCWWKHLQGKLKALGYSSSHVESFLYILKHATHWGAIWVHVNNGVVTGSSNSILKQLEEALKECLEIKWQASVVTIVGVEVQLTAEGYTLQQKKLIEKLMDVLRSTGSQQCGVWKD
jgi:hypothetical protein